MNRSGLGKIASGHVRCIPEFLDRGLYALPCLRFDIRVATEDTRYSHWRNTDVLGHLVHRYRVATASLCSFHSPPRLAVCRSLLPEHTAGRAHDTAVFYFHTLFI